MSKHYSPIFLSLLLILSSVLGFHTFKSRNSIAASSQDTTNLDQTQSLFDRLKIELTPQEPQEIILTNNNITHFTMESNKLETRKWQGLVHQDNNYLTNIWFAENDIQLNPDNISNTRLTPLLVEVEYDSGANETIFMPDNYSGIVYQFVSKSNILSFDPTFAMRIDYYSSSPLSNYDVTFDADRVMYIKAPGTKYLALIAPETQFTSNPRLINRAFPKDDLRNDGSYTENIYSPGSFSINSNKLTIVAGIGDTKQEAKATASKIKQNLEALKIAKSQRLRKLVNENQFEMDLLNSTLNLQDAYAWTLLSIDKLKMRRFGEGMYAGLHWFDDYWGRDTFIAFQGALLATGQWGLAKKTLLTMANFQQKNPSSYTFGRVPNRVSIEGTTPDYSTADGTGWYVKAIADYVKISGDIDFAREIISSVELAINGEESRTDAMGLVTHRPRETWMDAQQGNAIYTPRADRAIEIQALYYNMYTSLIYLYTSTNTSIDKIDGLKQKQDNLLSAIQDNFWRGSVRSLYDYLNPDGTPNDQRRPNQFIALSLLPEDFLEKYELEWILNKNIDLIGSAGVRTLSPDDPGYKPRHDGGNYHHDAAYHNGDIWPWLSSYTSEFFLKMENYGNVSKLLDILVSHVLTKNPVGGIGEIFDGNADGVGESVGAVFQLWSMSELIRLLNYILPGYQPDYANQIITLAPVGYPVYTQGINSLHYGNKTIYMTVEDSENYFRINLDQLPEDVTLKIRVQVKSIRHKIFITPDLDYTIKPSNSPKYQTIVIKSPPTSIEIKVKIPDPIVSTTPTTPTSTSEITQTTITTETSSDSQSTEDRANYKWLSSLILIPIFIRKKRYYPN